MSTTSVRDVGTNHFFIPIDTQLSATDLKVSALVLLTGFTYAERLWNAPSMANKIVSIFFMIPVVGLVAQTAIWLLSDINKPCSEALLYEGARASIVVGNVESLRFLLSQGRSLSQGSLENLQFIAVLENQIEALCFLLSQGRSLSQGSLEKLLTIAALKNQVEVLRFLLRESRPLIESLTSAPLVAAIKEEKIEALRVLLSDARITDRILEVAVLSAMVLLKKSERKS